jgi:hypothetical protein
MITAESSSLFQTPETNVFSPGIVPPLNQLQEYMCFKYTGDSADDDRMAQEKVQTLLTDRQTGQEFPLDNFSTVSCYSNN